MHVHGHVDALCRVEQEEGGYYEGFIHVEEILSRSFGVCEVVIVFKSCTHHVC